MHVMASSVRPLGLTVSSLNGTMQKEKQHDKKWQNIQWTAEKDDRKQDIYVIS